MCPNQLPPQKTIALATTGMELEEGWKGGRTRDGDRDGQNTGYMSGGWGGDKGGRSRMTVGKE